MNLQTLKSTNFSTSQFRDYTDCVHCLVSERRQRCCHRQANFGILDSPIWLEIHLLGLIFNKFIYFRVFTAITLHSLLRLTRHFCCRELAWAKWFENFASYMIWESVPSSQSELLEGVFFYLIRTEIKKTKALKYSG